MAKVNADDGSEVASRRLVAARRIECRATHRLIAEPPTVELDQLIQPVRTRACKCRKNAWRSDRDENATHDKCKHGGKCRWLWYVRQTPFLTRYRGLPAVHLLGTVVSWRLCSGIARHVMRYAIEPVSGYVVAPNGSNKAVCNRKQSSEMVPK